MSEKLLKIMLAELETIRIVCKDCKTVFEFPLDNLEKAFRTKDKTWECPHCHNPVMGDSSGSATGGPFVPLLKAIRLLKDAHEKIDVQFIIREDQ
jgi:hypothetical protein